MATDQNLLPALKLKLRRKYTRDVVGLQKLSDEVFAKTTDVVTITSHTFVDGSSSGEITCPRATLLLAIEEVLIELDPAAPRFSNAAVCYFR